MSSEMMQLRISKGLSLIRENGKISRVKLTKKMEIDKPCIATITNNLLEKKTVVDTGIDDRKRDVRGYILSIDVGGTKTIVSIIDLQGQILRSERFPSYYKTPEMMAESLISRLTPYIQEFGVEQILGISVGVPGIVDKKTGIVRFIPAFGFVDADIKTPIEKKLELPVVIDNDVTLAAFGETWIGSARAFENVLLVSIGTGIGCGLILQKEVYTGFNGSAGEIGEMITDWSNEKQVPQGFGRLERWLSGYALETFNANQSYAPDVKTLFERMYESEKIEERIRTGCIHLGLALSNAVILLDPEKIILAGGIGYNQYEKIYPIVDEVLSNVLPKSLYRKELLGKALLEPYCVVIGGAYLVQKRFLLGSSTP